MVDGGNTAIYTYDSLNRRTRLQANTGTFEFAFDVAGRRVSTWSVPHGAPVEASIYADSQVVAIRTSGETRFEHSDYLGTRRGATGPTGSPEAAFVSLPFGDGFSSSGYDGDWLHFAGLDFDSESSTHHAQFRQYSSSQGRWLSPDPFDGSYNALNPQSLNRYSYVLNNPMALVDPSGLSDCSVDDPDCGAGCSYGDPCGGMSPLGPPPQCTFDVCVTDTPDPPPDPSEPILLPILSSAPNGGNGGGTAPIAPGPSKAPPGMMHCSGTARVLQGNSAQIGHPGGWSGSSVGPINVTANGAAIIPSQWGVTNKGPFRQYLNQISGVFPNAGASFQGVSEIIGGAPVSAFPNLPVQQGLMASYPGMLILELPGGQDLGVNGTAVTLTVPTAVGCPAGTSQVP